MEIIFDLASNGLVHCDFNEFNLLISDASVDFTISLRDAVAYRNAIIEYLVCFSLHRMAASP
jgi:RIO-like serine/threonine protein kinase